MDVRIINIALQVNNVIRVQVNNPLRGRYRQLMNFLRKGGNYFFQVFISVRDSLFFSLRTFLRLPPVLREQLVLIYNRGHCA